MQHRQCCGQQHEPPHPHLPPPSFHRGQIAYLQTVLTGLERLENVRVRIVLDTACPATKNCVYLFYVLQRDVFMGMPIVPESQLVYSRPMGLVYTGSLSLLTFGPERPVKCPIVLQLFREAGLKICPKFLSKQKPLKMRFAL